MIWQTLLNNPWVKLGFILLLVLFVTKIVAFLITKVLKRLTSITGTKRDDELVEKLENPLVYFIGLVFLRWAIAPIGFTPERLEIVQNSVETIIIIIVAYIITVIADLFLEVWGQEVAKRTKSGVDDQLLRLFHRSVSIVIGVLAFLYILSSWNIEIWPLLGSLGIAGIAIAFAFQETLKNLFGGISLILDKNIAIGDVVQLPSGESGKIYDMTLRSTRIRTWDNKLLIIPNGIMANEVITNISRPDKSRRITVSFGVAYGTDPEYVKHIVLKEVKNIKYTAKDPEPRVLFQSMGDSALLFDALYWVDDMANFIEAKETGTIKIYELLNRESISIPFPQRTVWSYDMGKYTEQKYIKKKIPKEKKSTPSKKGNKK